MARNRAGLAVMAALALAVAAGCLEFDEQTVYFEYDRHRDTVLMIVNYGGLYAAAESARPDIENSQKQLEDAIQARRVAFGDNWPFTWSSEDVRKKMTDPQQNEHTPPAVREKLGRLAELVQVLNGGFYTDGAGRICGAQVVVIEHASEAINLINDVFNASLLADAEKEKGIEAGEFDSLAREYARKGHRWVDLDGNSLIVRVPATEKMVKEEWASLVAGMDFPKDQKPDAVMAQLKKLLSTPMFIWYEDGFVRFRLGLPSYPPQPNTRPAKGDYQPNVVDYITQKHGVDLDARIARSLLAPDALPDTEADRAAKFMAPRLTKAERVRVLVHQLRAAPSEPLWAMLRKEPSPEGQKPAPASPANEDLLKQWEAWLKLQASPPKVDTSRADEAQPAPAQK